LIYINAAWDETPLALWLAGQFLKANGASVAPTWEAPTVDINGLTDDENVLDGNDRLVMFNGSVNVKRTAKASATNEWLIEILTDAEARTGTNEEKAVNAKQLASEVQNRPWKVIAGTVYTASSSPTISFTNSSYVMLRSWTPLRAWVYRVSWDLNHTFNTVSSIQIRISGTQVWPTISTPPGLNILFSIDATVAVWQTIEIWWIRTAWLWTANVTDYLVRYDVSFSLSENTFTTS